MKLAAASLAVVFLASAQSSVIAADDADGSAGSPGYERTEEVIYGRKHGLALTMDVFTPDEPNGFGVAFMVSGGWHSNRSMIHPRFFRPLLERGYTVFAVGHGSQPMFTLRNAVDDVHRGVRYIKHHAERYSVAPERLGVTGLSAGGHLSLMLGCESRPADPDADDPVMRHSSRIAAVACFFPPTDFLNYGEAGRIATDYAPIKANFLAPFEFRRLDEQTKRFVRIDDAERRQEIMRTQSPLYHASEDDPPTLIIHGDADQLVPYSQSERMIEKLDEAGATAKLVTKKDEAHGWSDINADIPRVADWFDRHLREVTPR